MENKTKKTNKLKTKINELKSTSKGLAILKLIRWGIFFAILFIFLIISAFIKPPANPNNSNNNANLNSPPNESPNEPQVNSVLSKETFKQIKTTFLNGSYDYKYEIMVGTNQYLFTGTKTLTSETGYKENNSEIIKYYIDETGTYVVKLTDKEPISNLYEGLNTNYMNLNTLLSEYETKEFTLKENNDLQVYSSETNSGIFLIAFQNNIIKYLRITETNEDINSDYYMEFSNIEV